MYSIYFTCGISHSHCNQYIVKMWVYQIPQKTENNAHASTVTRAAHWMMYGMNATWSVYYYSSVRIPVSTSSIYMNMAMVN